MSIEGIYILTAPFLPKKEKSNKKERRNIIPPTLKKSRAHSIKSLKAPKIERPKVAIPDITVSSATVILH